MQLIEYWAKVMLETKNSLMMLSFSGLRISSPSVSRQAMYSFSITCLLIQEADNRNPHQDPFYGLAFTMEKEDLLRNWQKFHLIFILNSHLLNGY